MSKKQTSTALVLKGTEIQVPDLLTLLKQELEKLQKITDSPFKTTGNLEGFGDIKTQTKVENLIRAMSMVQGKEASYLKAAEGPLMESLGGTYPVFSISGGNVSEWAHDINLQIQIVKYESRKKELEELLAEAKTYMTKEDQYNMFLQKLQSKISK